LKYHKNKHRGFQAEIEQRGVPEHDEGQGKPIGIAGDRHGSLKAIVSDDPVHHRGIAQKTQLEYFLAERDLSWAEPPKEDRGGERSLVFC